MTGDGVNDAPALKKADCGIAVSGATDAARAAASIVLLAPGLSVIIDAIKESRKILQRMNSYSMYRIAKTLRVVLFMTVAILWFNFYPVTAVMIVMIALLNDGAILSIACRSPRRSRMPRRSLHTQMPNMNGFEFLSVVRQRFLAVPVIVVSGEFSGISVPESVLADAFFPKGSYKLMCRSLPDVTWMRIPCRGLSKFPGNGSRPGIQLRQQYIARTIPGAGRSSCRIPFIARLCRIRFCSTPQCLILLTVRTGPVALFMA